MAAQRFRKRPLVVEAVQWTGHNRPAIEAMIPAGAENPFGGADSMGSLGIYTKEGLLLANTGDWIVRGIKGEFYPVAPDIFEATYEAVTDDGGRVTQAP